MLLCKERVLLNCMNIPYLKGNLENQNNLTSILQLKFIKIQWNIKKNNINKNVGIQLNI